MKQKLLKIYFLFFAILAKKYIKRYKPFVIGVTGSIGKTSSRMIISEILSQKLENKIIYTSDKNFNGELGLSLSILGISNYTPTFFGIIKTLFNSIFIAFFGKKKYDIIFLEYGIDYIGEMDFLLSIVKPDIALVTKIDKVHSSQFKTKEVIANEKYKLLINTKKLVFLNKDDEFYKNYESLIKAKKIYFKTSLEKEDDIDIYGKNYSLNLIEKEIISSFDFYFLDKKITKITSNLIGEDNIGYINIGVYILDYLENKYNKKSILNNNIKEINFDFTLQYSRFSKFDGINNSILIDSSYNAAPESMKKVIDNFLLLHSKIYTDYEIILCLGEMRELGEYTKLEHENIANYLKNTTKNIFLVGESMQKYVLPITDNAKFFKNSKILGKSLKDFLLSNQDKKYLILFKGSQNTIFLEEAVKEVLFNKKDISKICRQEDFWINVKNNFFNKKNNI